MVRVYNRPTDQGEPVNQAFLLQQQKMSCSQVENFNHSNVYWENTVSSKQSKRLLKPTDNFLVQVSDRLTRSEVLLDLVLSNVEENIKEIKIICSLVYCSNVLVDFMTSRKMAWLRVESGP